MQYAVRVINPRKRIILTGHRAVVVRVKRDPAAIAARFFDLDFRGLV